ARPWPVPVRSGPDEPGTRFHNGALFAPYGLDSPPNSRWGKESLVSAAGGHKPPPRARDSTASARWPQGPRPTGDCLPGSESVFFHSGITRLHITIIDP